VLDVFYHRAKFGGSRISPAAGAAKHTQAYMYIIKLPKNVTDLHRTMSGKD